VLAFARWLVFNLDLVALLVGMGRRTSAATAFALPTTAIGSSMPKAGRFGASSLFAGRTGGAVGG
jgi:hypothetical protein